MLPSTSRICRETFPWGSAARAIRAVSSGTGLTGVGCSVIVYTPLGGTPTVHHPPVTTASLLWIYQRYLYWTLLIGLPSSCYRFDGFICRFFRKIEMDPFVKTVNPASLR